MKPIRLLSNGTYHVDVDADGCGRSRLVSLALTRWREDGSGNAGGTYFYLRDDESRDVWSAMRRPMAGVAGEPPVFDAAAASFVGHHDDIETRLSVCVDATRPFEMRRLQVVNRSSRQRRLAVTSYAEIVLAPAATDAAHLAFSKLFVETTIDAALGAVFATRRPSSADQPRTCLFHSACVADATQLAGDLSFETDRMQFLGRGRDLGTPRALDDGSALAGHHGPVLDAIAAVRVPLVLAAGATCMVDFFTGTGSTADACTSLAREVRSAGVGDRVLAQADEHQAATLRRLGLSDADGLDAERLAAAILVAEPRWRGAPAEIAANRRGQSGLWGFGISGDLPIVLIRMGPSDGPDLLLRMTQVHAFWRAFGVLTEMAVVSAGTAPTPERQREWLAALSASPSAELLDKPGGVFLLTDHPLDDGDRLLLASSARLVVDGTTRLDSGDIDDSAHVPSRAPAGAGEKAPGLETTTAMSDVVFANGLGGLVSTLDEYVVTMTADSMTPAPWINVIANEGFGTLVSESGSASTWSENSHEFRLTPWSNDPVIDPNTEALYVRDEASGAFWSPTLLPTRGSGTYVARHGFGYSRFEHAEDGVESALVVFVAAEAAVKFSALTLRNRSTRQRRLSVTGYVEWVLGDERAKTAMHVVTELDAATGAILARNGYNTDFAERIAYFDVDRDGVGFGEVEACADRGDFIGDDGSLAAPAALRKPHLSGRVGAALDPCAALRVAFDLEPKAERTVVFRLGAVRGTNDVSEQVRAWRGADVAQRELVAVRARWHAKLGAVAVRTPSSAVDALANGWLLYQVIGSRLWGRTAFYQSSGAFGFRDQLQDVLALVHAAPELTRAHIVLAASRQFVEGDVQHWWHPPSGKGIRTRCSDDYLWLPFVLCRYVEATGDLSLLDENVAFLAAAQLADGEASRYERPQIATESASVYEHAVRAIRHGMRFGTRGLPLMGTCDWNDGMNLVGAGGRGESVWLAFFFIAVLKRFAPVARDRRDALFADECEREATRLAAQVDATSWDGAWYRRAYFDDGAPLGSASNVECRIDSIAQSWAVLSGGAPAERAKQAMDSLRTHLVKERERLVLLLAPPFDSSKPSPGYIQGYVPGVRENGGQYTHAAIWAAMAFAALGYGTRAWGLFELLDPLAHGSNAAQVATYKVEPYVVAGDVYAATPHVGRGGWTWYTGSAGWCYQLLVESLLGLSRRGDHLRLQPLLPAQWPGFELSYRQPHSSTTYEIHCRRAAADERAAVRIDGVLSVDGAIPLRDDGGTVTVEVVVAQDDARAIVAGREGTACNSE